MSSTPAFKRAEDDQLWSRWLECESEESIAGWIQLTCDQFVQACNSEVRKE